MPDASHEVQRVALAEAVRSAYRAGRGLPASLEQVARTFARTQREAGIAVERVIIEVKGIVRAETADDDLVYVPRLVGWTVAGYFAGTAAPDES